MTVGKLIRRTRRVTDTWTKRTAGDDTWTKHP